MKKSPPVKPGKQTYEQWKDEQIKLGLADLDAGRVISHEQFMRLSDENLRRLRKKHAQAA